MTAGRPPSRGVAGWTALVVLLILVGVTALATAPASARMATAPTGRRIRRRKVGAPATVVGDAPAAPPTGPYAVASIQVTLTDPTRPTAARGETPASPTRAIPVTIDYPALAIAPDPTVPDALVAAAAATPTIAAGTFPLVVFSPGFDVSAATYTTLEQQLAGAGFVVAAPDFPLTSSALPGAPDESDVSNQATDVSFVISSLLDPVRAPTVLFGAIADTQVGVIGHSDGGVTTAAVAYNSTVADPRIGAAIVLSGAEARYSGSWFTTQSPPLLAIHGTDDEVNPIASSEQLYDDATGSKMFVTVDGGSHLGPFTTDSQEPAVAVLAADFLRAQLDHDAVAAGRLPSDAAVPGVLSLADAA